MTPVMSHHFENYKGQIFKNRMSQVEDSKKKVKVQQGGKRAQQGKHHQRKQAGSKSRVKQQAGTFSSSSVELLNI